MNKPAPPCVLKVCDFVLYCIQNYQRERDDVFVPVFIFLSKVILSSFSLRVSNSEQLLKKILLLILPPPPVCVCYVNGNAGALRGQNPPGAGGYRYLELPNLGAKN